MNHKDLEKVLANDIYEALSFMGVKCEVQGWAFHVKYLDCVAKSLSTTFSKRFSDIYARLEKLEQTNKGANNEQTH